jgi:hypothetical protein
MATQLSTNRTIPQVQHSRKANGSKKLARLQIRVKRKVQLIYLSIAYVVVFFNNNKQSVTDIPLPQLKCITTAHLSKLKPIDDNL